MSVHAGSIIHNGGRNTIDRLQSAGLGDVRVNIQTIREVGNRLVVDKVPEEPDFTFSLESWDVSTDIMAWLTGKVGAGHASAQAPGAGDAPGTSYHLEDCGFVNIVSPWKDPDTGSAGVIEAGHIVPAYYPTRVTYRFGVTDNATMQVDLAGGSFYYAGFAPLEQYATGDGSDVTFVSDNNTIEHRIGGAGGSTFRNVFGVLVGTTLMVEGIDYTVSGGNGTPATITFTEAPALGAVIRFAYFTDAPQAEPQSVHPDVMVKPGAVRGRNIKVYLGSGGSKVRLGAVQSVELNGTIDGAVDRELGTDEIVGRQINGTDVDGTITIRSKDAPSFIAMLSKVTGVADDEVFGYFNQYSIPLTIQIENPKAPGTIIKTLVVDQAQFQQPGTPARVNTATDFALTFGALDGTFREVKGTYNP